MIPVSFRKVQKKIICSLVHHKKFTHKFFCLILLNSRIIWLGDLNYRIALSYLAAKGLVERRNWKALLEKDQVVA